MTVTPRIAFRNMDTSEALEARIGTRIAELEHLCDRMTSCSVIVEVHHSHPGGGCSYHVGIDLGVPGRTIVVRRDPHANHGHEDAYVAVREAFDAAKRQLEDYVRIHRGDVKSHAAKSPADA
jgi:ribosome-associated translation inhibitor RaiA